MKKKLHEMRKELSIYKKENAELKQFNYELQRQVIGNKGKSSTSSQDDEPIVRTDVSIFFPFSFCSNFLFVNHLSCQTEHNCDGRNKCIFFG